MAQTDPKYQIKIIKAGIGDPLLALSFEFTNSDGTFSIPNPDVPLNTLSFQITVSYENNSGASEVATVGMIYFGSLKSAGPYHCDLPFDNLGNFQMGDAVRASITFGGVGMVLRAAGEGGNVWSKALTYIQESTLLTSPSVSYGYFPS